MPLFFVIAGIADYAYNIAAIAPQALLILRAYRCHAIMPPEGLRCHRYAIDTLDDYATYTLLMHYACHDTHYEDTHTLTFIATLEIAGCRLL